MPKSLPKQVFLFYLTLDLCSYCCETMLLCLNASSCFCIYQSFWQIDIITHHMNWRIIFINYLMYDLGPLFSMHEFSYPKIEVFTVYIEKQILEAICAPLNSGAKSRTTMRFFPQPPAYFLNLTQL